MTDISAVVSGGDDLATVGTVIAHNNNNVTPDKPREIASSSGVQQIPTYDDTFPRLAMEDGIGFSNTVNGTDTLAPGNTNSAASTIAAKVRKPSGQQHAWPAQPASSTVTEVFHIPAEEKRFRASSEFGGGSFATEQARVAKDIMDKTGVQIDMSGARDGSLSVVITGRAGRVAEAKMLVAQQLHQQISEVIQIAQRYHRFLVGRKGERLSEIQKRSCTRISLPSRGMQSDNITIHGTREGIVQAVEELKQIETEQSRLDRQVLNIDWKYHIFVCGPNNENVRKLENDFDVRIAVPPPAVERNEITVSGEVESVRTVCQHIQETYETYLRKCMTVAVQVAKSQHRYVIGRGYSGIYEILAKTGCSAEVPPMDSDNESITLRGFQENLGAAVSLLCEKANSMVSYQVPLAQWLHGQVIGRKGSALRDVIGDADKVHVEFVNEGHILIEGPPKEAEPVRAKLEQIAKHLTATRTFAEINVEPRFHPHVIGKAGANVTRLKNDLDVTVSVPDSGSGSNVIRIEGETKNVAAAREEIQVLVKRMADERHKDIIVPSRLHKLMLAPIQGRYSIADTRTKYPQVIISFADQSAKSDIVQLRGPSKQVDQCYKDLEQRTKTMVEENYQSTVKIFAQYHSNLIGRRGQNVRKIREELSVIVDVPGPDSQSDIITLTGRKENVDKAKREIEKMQRELIKIVEEKVQIDHEFHQRMIGQRGQLIRQIVEDCGGVNIGFPPASNANDNTVTVRGPGDDVANAIKQLKELEADLRESNHREEVRCKPSFHPFLIGSKGTKVRKLREQTGARVIFPEQPKGERVSDEQATPEAHLIVIMGKKDAAIKAKALLEQSIANLANVVTETTPVPSRFHRHFVLRRGEVINQIAGDFGGVQISFPRQGATGEGSELATVKGAKDCVAGAIQRIREIVEDLEAQRTIVVEIAQHHHRAMLSNRGSQIQTIEKERSVAIRFPGRNVKADSSAPNNDAASTPESTEGGAVEEHNIAACDAVRVSGRNENCELARADLLALVPIERQVEFPFAFHRQLIGARGAEITKLMREYDVAIELPPAIQKKDEITIRGRPTYVDDCVAGLEKKLGEFEIQRKDEEARNFRLEIQVPRAHHTKLIGRRGALVDELRTKHDVQITVPPPNKQYAEDAKDESGNHPADKVTLIGYEAQCETAKVEILKLVDDWESYITRTMDIEAYLHPHLIGSRGRNVAKLMKDFQVEIRFPARNSNDPTGVTVVGEPANVDSTIEYLSGVCDQLEDEMGDRAPPPQAQPSPKKRAPQQNGSVKPKGNNSGFVVQGAPWQAPDTSSQAEFPSMGGSVASASPSASKPSVWGRK